MEDMAEEKKNTVMFGYMMGLSKEHAILFVEQFIELNDKRKINAIKYAYELGCDMSVIMETATRMNDIVAVGLCLKYGADIHRKNENDYTFLHIAALHGHNGLVKSFLQKGIKIDEMDQYDTTALTCALSERHFETMEILIEHGADLIISTNDDRVHMIEIMLDLYEPKLKKLFELIISKTNVKSILFYEEWRKCDHNDDPETVMFCDDFFNKIKKRIIFKNFDVIETLLYKFPKFVNYVIDDEDDGGGSLAKRLQEGGGHTLLNVLIKSSYTGPLLKLLSAEETILVPKKMKTPYLHDLCLVHDIESIVYFLDKVPDGINMVDYEGRTPIYYVLFNHAEHSDEIVINTLNILLQRGCDKQLNDRHGLKGTPCGKKTKSKNLDSDYSRRLIEAAIQFSTPNVVKYLIDSGCEIGGEVIDKTKYSPSLINNDVLAFASQQNKEDTVELLLKYEAPINMLDGMPTAVLNAIDHDAKRAMKKLMSNSKIVKICSSDNINKKLLNFCVDIGRADKEMMQYFTDTQNLEVLKVNGNTLIFNRIEKHFETIFRFYEKDKLEIFTGMRDTMIFLKHLSTPYVSLQTKQNNRTMKKLKKNTVASKWGHALHQMSFLMKKYLRATSNDFFDILKELILGVCIKEHDKDFSECFDNLKMIEKSEDTRFIVAAWENIVNIQKERLYVVTDVLNNLLGIFVNKINSLVSALDQENKNEEKMIDRGEYKVHYETDDRYIKRVLSRLSYPKKMIHYDEMHDRLKGLNCVMNVTKKYVLVRDNNTKISALIFNEGTDFPKEWFQYYTHNIGRDDKCNTLHMFPFALDKTLQDVHCYQKPRFDIVNKYGKVHMLCFFGILIHNCEYRTGVFEYFIDATLSLFHRFFKPLDEMSEGMKESVMSHFPKDYERRYEMARKLMLSF